MSRQVAWKELLSRMVMWAKEGKSRAWIAASMSRMRAGTTVLARVVNRLDVATVVCMPAVLLTPFFSALATRMRARISGQWDSGATSRAALSSPSSRVPASHATYPPNRLRQADPEPCRAMSESSRGDWGRAYKSAMARTRAAKPAAEEARPAAVGKLLLETRRRGYVESGGRLGSAASRA